MPKSRHADALIVGEQRVDRQYRCLVGDVIREEMPDVDLVSADRMLWPFEHYRISLERYCDVPILSIPIRSASEEWPRRGGKFETCRSTVQRQVANLPPRNQE